MTFFDRLQTPLFAAYASLFIWLPIPLGSKYPWAISIMEIWIYGLSMVVIIMVANGSLHLSRTFTKNLLPITLLALTTLWVGFQCISLPTSLLFLLSPQALSLHQLSGSDETSISLNAAITWLQFHKALAYLLLFTLTLILVNSKKRLKILVYTIVLSAFFQACAAMFLHFSDIMFTIHQYTYSSIDDLYQPHPSRVTGFHSNPDHLAGLMEMSLAVGIGLLISMLRSIEFNSWRQRIHHYIQTILGPKARLRIILIILCIALVMTLSRMGNTAFFSSLIISGLIFIFFSRHASRSVTIFLISLILLDIMIIGSMVGVGKVVDRIEQTTTAQEAQRSDVYADTLSMTADFRLSGIGSGNFFSAFPAYKVDGPSYYIDHVHNDYLEFLVDLGLIGITPLCLLILLTFSTIIVNLRHRHSGLLLGVSFASLMGLTSILIHSSVDFNLQVPANAALFTTLVALPFVCRQLKQSEC